MISPLIGRARGQVLEALRRNWLEGNHTVALLEGFSGTGKSVLAGELTEASKIATARVDAFADDEGLQNLFLDLAIALEALGIDNLSKELDKGAQANLASSLREVIRHNRVLVIIDEAQHTFLPNTTRPAARLAAIIKQLGDSKTTGKLLLISNRIVEREVWSENCFPARLPPLEEGEAVELLSRLLEHQKRSEKVESERKVELVRCLGCNPRAIHTLVTCLEFETVDALISSIPGMWDLRDVEVSPELVVQLEKDLLGRILPKLEDDKNTAKFLRWLSVHRQPFRKEALDGFQGAGFSSAELLHSLVERMLLEFRHGWHTLNAIAREISVQRLKQANNEWIQAHSLAANYHARHFRAKQIPHVERLGVSFAELRYHLFQAGRLEELEELSERFTTFIRQSINVTQIPSEPANLDERIALLTILLGKQGAKGLEFHLARCLLKRNASGDREVALEHIRRATGAQAPFEAWLIRINLEREIVGLAAAQSVWTEALRWVAPSENEFSIYLRAAELLAQDGEVERAIDLLSDGLENIPPEFNQHTLYQLCADLMACNDDLVEAIALLREGIAKIPMEFGQSKLVYAALRLAYQANRKDIIEELIAFMSRIGGSVQFLPHRYYGKCLNLSLDKNWSGVLETAEGALQLFHSIPLMAMKAEAHIGLANLEAAWLDLVSYEKRGHGNKPSLWLKAWIAVKTGRQSDADQFAAQYAEPRTELQFPVTEERLLKLWSTLNVERSVAVTTFFRSLQRWLQPTTTDASIAVPLASVPVLQPEVVSKSFLIVTTEWDSKNGGISTFNRLFCKALAMAKQKVACYVPTASEDEIHRAAGDGVRLVSAQPEAGVPAMATLLNPPEEIKNLNPDFIVGHDRQSGGYAKVLQKRDFPGSKRIHFIHTAPEEIELSKPSRAATAAKRGEERVKEQKNQAKDAVLIAGVGPRLAREFGNHVHGGGYAPIHEFNPGFDLDGGTSDASAAISLPPAIVCLLLGRAEDYELKGLDLAAQSMSAVANSWKPMVLPKLVVRGAPEGKGDELSKKLRADIHSTRPLQIIVREYSEDLEAIQNDLRGASLMLMPSCVEGFGLVAMEAICMGIPVLISEQSGIAEVLPDTARDIILSTRPDALTPLDAAVTKKWAKAIERTLNNRDKAFAAAKKLKLEMAAKYTWQEVICGFLKALGVATQ